MDQGRSAALDRIRTIARLWDEAVRIPIVGVRVGLDALVGLAPGVGDLIGLVVSGYLIAESVRLGARGPVVVRMVANVGLDALIGAVPLLGDVFDVGWKANRRNRELLERWLESPGQATRTSALVVGAAVATVVGALGVAGWLIATAVGAIVG